MREIKFRAWDKEMEAMRDWNTIICHDIGVFRHREWYELMQYTGLKDKNGVEIYEGDIVRRSVYFPGDDVVQIIGTIKYFNHEARFVFRYNGQNHDAYHRYNEWVIGNIHENPHLLKEKNK